MGEDDVQYNNYPESRHGVSREKETGTVGKYEDVCGKTASQGYNTITNERGDVCLDT